MTRLPCAPAPALLTCQPALSTGTCQTARRSPPTSVTCQAIGPTGAAKSSTGMAIRTGATACAADKGVRLLSVTLSVGVAVTTEAGTLATGAASARLQPAKSSRQQPVASSQ